MNYTDTALLSFILITLCVISGRLDSILDELKKKKTDENQQHP